MPQEQPLIEKSYRRLKQKYNMPAYEDYVKLLETPEGRQKAYSRLSQKYRMPTDFQTFDADVKKQLPRSLLGQLAEGFKQSNIGLSFEGVRAIPTGGAPIFAPIPRTEVPEVKEPNTFAQGLATQAGTLVGDFPAMLLGGAMALPSRNPAVIAGASFAAPEALRQAQLEFLEKGTDRPFFATKDVSELAGRMVAMRNLQQVPEYNPESVVGSLLKAGAAGTKGFAIGAATAGAGAAAPVGFKTAAEIGTLATLPHVIEGELPTMQSIAEATVLVGGLKLAARGAKQIAKVAKRRGQTVEEVVNEIKEEADPQKALDALESKVEGTKRREPPPKPVESPEPTPTTSYSVQFNDAVETAKNTLLVTRGLDENVRRQRLQEALKDYDPLVADEILNPRREVGGAVSREERAEVSVEPSAERKSIVDAIAEASVQTSNWRTQLDAIKAELTKRLEASGLTEAQVPTSGGKAVPLSIKRQPKLSSEQQRIVQDAINLAAEEGGFSVETVGRGLEIIATPEKLPTFDFSQTPIEQLVQTVEPVKAQLRTQLDNLKIAKVVGRDVLTDYFFESKARGESATPLKGVTSTGEIVSVKVNRARSASRPDVEPWKQYVEEIEARERQLASETEGTLVIGKPQEPTVGNTLFTQSAYNEALARMRRVGITPKPEENLRDAITVGGYYFEKGLREFQRWSESVVKDLGENIRPQLPAIWNTLHTVHAVGELKTAQKLLDAIERGEVAKTSKGFEEVSTNKKELLGTKVVDEKGEPKRVYHGTNAVFEEFDPKFQDPAALYGRGFYFTEDPKVASSYTDTKDAPSGAGQTASNVKPAYLNIRKPFDMDGKYALADLVGSDKIKSAFVEMNLRSAIKYKSGDLFVGRPDVSHQELAKSPFLKASKIFSVPSSAKEYKEYVSGWYINGQFIETKASIPSAVANLELEADALYRLFDRKSYVAIKTKSGHVHVGKSVSYEELAKLSGVELEQSTRGWYYRDEFTTQPPPNLGEFRDFLKQNKFDGITHIGGAITGGDRHRVWIAFDADQIVYPDEFAKPRIKSQTFERESIQTQAELSKSVLDFFSESIKGITEPTSSVKQQPPEKVAPEGKVYHGSNSSVVNGIIEQGGFSSEVKFGARHNTTKSFNFAFGYGKDKALKADGIVNIVETPDRSGIIPLDEIVIHEFNRSGEYLKSYNMKDFKGQSAIVEALSESVKGITELAGGKRLGIQPYSRANYNAALPHFRAAWKAYKTAGRRFKEFERDMRSRFGQNIDLYLAQYRKEIDSSDFVRILSEATLPDENFIQLDASLPSIWALSPEQSARTAGKGFINSTGRKAPVEVNLETPGIQDITSFIIGSEGQALEVITRDVSHINRVRREAFAETAQVSPKTIVDPGRPFLGAITRKRFEKTDAEIVNAAKKYYKTGNRPTGVSKAVFNAAEEVEVFMRLLDSYTVDYGKTLAQLGEKPATVRKAIAELTKLRDKVVNGKNPKDFWNDLELDYYN